MRNLYPKSKGKIYPSSAPPSAVNGNGNGDALAVLRLLPVAIFALAAALAAEDKEVVAYLMIRSIHGSGPATEAADNRRRCRRPGAGGAHRPLFDCGCFDCYTSFWSRWDCSNDREAIHMVIEAFEEHLASKEKRKDAKRKRRKSKDEKRETDTEKGRERNENVVMVEIVVAEKENKGFEDEAVTVSDVIFADEKLEEMERVNEVIDEAALSPAVSGERRKGWADFVGGMFNSRLFNLWNPAA